MTRMNEAAYATLCDMLSDKASAKRGELLKELRAVEDEIKTSYNKHAEAARRDVEAVLSAVFKSKISRILAKHELGGMEFSYNNRSGECRYNFIDDEGYKRRIAKEKELADLDTRVKKAKQDIRLRVALGVRYDEAVAVVNSFQF